MIRATVVCATCENNEIYQKEREKKMLFTLLSMCQIFFCFCFPGKTGIPKIKDLKDVLGDVCLCSHDVLCVCF